MASTTNHVQIPNFVPSTTSTNFNQVWKLTRALKKAGWKYLASGNGTTKDTTSDPVNDGWNGTGVGTTAGITTNAGAAAASIAAPTRGRATVTGLSGIVSTDKGKFLVITGGATAANNHSHQIEEIVSGSSVRIDARTFAVASDANNGALTWSVKDPANTTETYPSATLAAVAAWWVGRGPSTLKIPITSAPVAGTGGFTFVRGENIVQTSSGWEGEIIGFVFDGVSSGYLVAAPRLRGTGVGIYGFTDGQVITGATSGATVTQNGTALEYRHEIVIAKANNETSGTIGHVVYEPVAEGATNSFLTIAAQAGATATVAPGATTTTANNGANNGFPTFGWISLGQGAGTHVVWVGVSGSITYGNAQIMCVDAIEEQLYSADGSWTYPMAYLETPGGGHVGHGFYRCDDCEDGDLDPYVSFGQGSSTLYGNARTTNGAAHAIGAAVSEIFTTSLVVNTTTFTVWRGWRKRGQTGDTAANAQDFEMGLLFCQQNNGRQLAISVTDFERVATALVSTRVREPIWILSSQNLRKMRKGTVRWMYMVQGNNGTDLFDSKQWVQLSPTTIPFIAGPWDGSSTPTTFT